jgi:poly-gamma-glutamate capsule biosynthesis protein CapA/YwtB (metallophosphatase superfamily)
LALTIKVTEGTITKKETVTLLGLGDIIIDREKPETIFQYVADTLRSADITAANCDQTYSDKGSLIHGHGTNSEPRNIAALQYAGFDVVSLANNHVLDRGSEALLDTIVRLKASGIPCLGAGKNLAEARQPIVLERKGTRVGFLAYSSVHPKGSEAEENKPGIAPVRVWTIYEQVDYQPGTSPRIVTVPYPEDMAAMVQDIRQLKAQVDVLVIYFHWGLHNVPRVIPQYCYNVGHAAIDAGADLILGTHTHILKGIEVYQGKVIFYSISNFAAEIGPAILSGSAEPAIPRLVLERFKSHEARQTVIAKAIIEDGQIKRVSYLPCLINEQLEPEIMTAGDAQGREVYEYMKDISRSEGLNARFCLDGDEVLILLA